MIVKNLTNTEEKKIDRFPYKGQQLEVKNVTIRWLSQAGPQDSPDYGLRFFTIGPDGYIPIHKHFYCQTMYILSGRVSVSSHDADSDQKKEEKSLGPNDFVFIPSMEPHSIKNLSGQEKVTFLCCIANVYEEEE